MLPVYDENEDKIEFRIWLMDSGHKNGMGQKGSGCVNPDQVDWYR